MRAFHRRAVRTRLHALIALECLFGIVYGAFSLTLPILADSLTAKLALLGFIFSFPEIVGTFIDVPIGEFAKRWGRRRMIFYSGLLLAISSVFFMMVKQPLAFLAALVFYEIATQSFIIPGDAEETALTPAKSTGRFNALLEGFHNLGFSLGPVIAGFAIGLELRYALWITIFVSVLMMLVSLRYVPKEEEHESFWKAAVHLVTRDKILKRGFSEFSGLGFEGAFVAFIFFAFAVHWGFVGLMEPLYTQALGIPDFEIGLIYAGFTLPIFFISFLVGKYLDRRSAKWITVAGLLLHALSAVGFSFAFDPKLLFVLALVSGVGDALILPAIFTMFDRLSSYHTKEHVSGIKMFGESLGYFLGPLLGGAISAAFGFSVSFLAIGIFLLVLALVTGIVPLRVADPFRAAQT